MFAGSHHCRSYYHHPSPDLRTRPQAAAEPGARDNAPFPEVRRTSEFLSVESSRNRFWALSWHHHPHHSQHHQCGHHHYPSIIITAASISNIFHHYHLPHHLHGHTHRSRGSSLRNFLHIPPSRPHYYGRHIQSTPVSIHRNRDSKRLRALPRVTSW